MNAHSLESVLLNRYAPIAKNTTKRSAGFNKCHAKCQNMDKKCQAIEGQQTEESKLDVAGRCK
ncbi:hypothetical protein MA16_Dca002456 [Dendrobium catenatum]|uniref:Uncharacterized protein n=1 Tax=Dendrobium catenatum TaxID=906689 RepID=A0A2I0W0K8_9ASPA|nr:hypothetical protein MA16_Dca002456 [Dendrobium catenatum]